jgi:hypothetical protein
MSAERELLELAAKAAALLVEWDGDGFVRPVPFKGFTNYEAWNPLTDDGDALRLAVKLRMDVKQWNSLVIAVKAWNSHAEENTFTQCPYAATRRAIVRAAAAIGKAMP